MKPSVPFEPSWIQTVLKAQRELAKLDKPIRLMHQSAAARAQEMIVAGR